LFYDSTASLYQQQSTQFTIYFFFFFFFFYFLSTRLPKSNI